MIFQLAGTLLNTLRKSSATPSRAGCETCFPRSTCLLCYYVRHSQANEQRQQLPTGWVYTCSLPHALSHYVCFSPSNATAASTRASPITTPTPQLESARGATFTTWVQAGASARKHPTRFTCARPTPGQRSLSFSLTAALTLLRTLQDATHLKDQVRTLTPEERSQ